MVTSRELGMGSIGVGEWEIKAVGCKIGYKDILYNMGNIANIFKWSITFKKLYKNCIKI